MNREQKRAMGAKGKQMEKRASELEERATQAENEAVLRKRINEARVRISAAKPGRSISLSWIRLPKNGTVRVLLVLATLIAILLLLAKACG